MTYDQAKEFLKDAIDKDGGLFNEENYASWNPGKPYVVLDGQFTAHELEAIAVYMRGYHA